MNEKIVKYGVSKTHIAFVKSIVDGVVTYDTPVAIPGTVKIGVEPQGDEIKFYADNTLYYSKFTQAGYEGTLELANIPDVLLQEALGQIKDKNGALVEVENAETKDFALIYQVETSNGPLRYVFYSCSMSRPSEENSTTEDGAEPVTNEATLSIKSIKVGDKNVTKARLDKASTGFDTIFTEVYMPEFTETP